MKTLSAVLASICAGLVLAIVICLIGRESDERHATDIQPVSARPTSSRPNELVPAAATGSQFLSRPVVRRTSERDVLVGEPIEAATAVAAAPPAVTASLPEVPYYKGGKFGKDITGRIKTPVHVIDVIDGRSFLGTNHSTLILVTNIDTSELIEKELVDLSDEVFISTGGVSYEPAVGAPAWVNGLRRVAK